MSAIHFCHFKAALCVAPRANSAAIPPSSRLCQPGASPLSVLGRLYPRTAGRGRDPREPPFRFRREIRWRAHARAGRRALIGTSPAGAVEEFEAVRARTRAADGPSPSSSSWRWTSCSPNVVLLRVSRRGARDPVITLVLQVCGRQTGGSPSGTNGRPFNPLRDAPVPDLGPFPPRDRRVGRTRHFTSPRRSYTRSATSGWTVWNRLNLVQPLAAHREDQNMNVETQLLRKHGRRGGRRSDRFPRTPRDFDEELSAIIGPRGEQPGGRLRRPSNYISSAGLRVLLIAIRKDQTRAGGGLALCSVPESHPRSARGQRIRTPYEGYSRRRTRAPGQLRQVGRSCKDLRGPPAPRAGPGGHSPFVAPRRPGTSPVSALGPYPRTARRR